MALDAAGFIARFPEFTAVNTQYPALIPAYIATAFERVSPERFNTVELYTQAHALMTARLLGRTPYGIAARLNPKQDRTIYDAAWDEMAQVVGSGPLLL